MVVVYADKDLKEAMGDEKLLLKLHGKLRSTILLRRIQTIKVVEKVEELKLFPGRFHELTGDRAGQWACDLDQPYRLVFEELPEETVRILEIVKYHGK